MRRDPRATLAIFWPQRARKISKEHYEAAQMYGIVNRFYASITDDPGLIQSFSKGPIPVVAAPSPAVP